uniref:Carm_PH domain-containing protein n=1 Tax=Meloidogyne hapla TaxID=6305 RepID=A0A1I8BYH0_MELHA
MMASLTREKAEEICQHIRTNPDSIFGQKYWQCRHACIVQSQQKADKWETRFLLQIGWEDRPVGTKSFSSTPIVVFHLFLRKPDGTKTKDLALELLSTLKHYFPEIQKSLTKLFISLSPPSLIADFALLPLSTPELPCNNFRRSYVAYCDWMEQPFRDEIIWDIERIYFFHGQHELDLNDFSHLSLKDQQALIGSIQFSSFFTGIFADSLRLQNEHIDSLILLIRRSHSLRSLYLNRCTFPIKDFLSQFSIALSTNINLPLERLRFVGIALEDKKGLTQLGTLLPQLSSLLALSFAECLLNEKCALALLNGLHHGIRLANDSAKGEDATVTGNTLINSDNGRFQLEALNLSGNPLGSGVELAEQLANFLALNTGAIRFLDLNGTAIQLDRLWAALKLGGLGLEVLRLGGCHIAQTKRSIRNSGGKDSAQIAKELFSSFLSLKELDMTGTHLTAELLSGILEGISTNSNLSSSSLALCLDNCIVGSTTQCVNVFEQYLFECPCICSLSLRDNSLEHETYRLLPIICKMRGLRKIDIGGANFFGLKANKKHAQMLSAIVTEFVRLVNGEEEESLGPGGARLLGKSLQLNQSLRQLSLDRNQIGIEGFYELARALRLNNTLLSLDLPTSDLSDSMALLARIPIERARLMAIIAEIEEALKRNVDLSTISGPTNGQLAMRTMHSLNIGCDLYNINGSETSEIKKIAFHKIRKLIAQIGEQKTNDINIVNNSFKNDGDKRRVKIIGKFIEELGQFVEENNKNFLQIFFDRLATQDECAWEYLFANIDNALRSDDQNYFKILEQKLGGTIKTTTISNRKGILLRSPAESKSSNYRPISSIMSNNNQQNGLIPSIMSQSVLGNFGFFENEKERKEETSSPTKLVHLAKHRPKPARLQRKKKLEETEEEEAVNALDEVLAKEEVDPLEQIPTIISSSPEPPISTLGQSLERSPLLLQQRLKNQEEKEEPPPIPSKRGTSCENSTPPKLPPKPSPPMGDLENRRNKLLDEKEEEIIK